MSYNSNPNNQKHRKIQFVINALDEGRIATSILARYCDIVFKHIMVYDNGHKNMGVVELTEHETKAQR